MKVIGALCWAEEDPLWLMAAVTAIAPLLDHLVALDGKYVLYPNAMNQPASGVEQSLAIVEACAAANLGLTLYRPSEPFIGNEVEKRNLSVALAQNIKDSEDDWLVVFDGDQIARQMSPGHIRKDLEASEHLVAEYARYEDPSHEGFTAVRGIYRLVDGLKYGPAHWTISAPKSDGSRIWFWGDPWVNTPYVDDFLNLTASLKFDHRNHMRNANRRQNAREYYDMRDRLKIESQTLYHTRNLENGWVERA